MEQYNRVCLVVVLALLAGIFIAQPAAFADEDRFYGKVGGGMVWFNPPDKDSTPFYETGPTFSSVGRAGRVHSPIEFDLDDSDAAWNIAFGYRLGDPMPDGLLGANLRFEFSTNFYFPEDSSWEVLSIPATTSFPAGQTVGVFYNDRGLQGATPLAWVSPALEDAAHVKFHSDYDFLDFLINVRSDYALMKDVLTLSPYLGLTLAFFDQNFSYSARSPASVAGPLGGINDYTAKEDLDSWYAGITLGTDLVFSATPELSFSLGASFSPLYADHDMDLDFMGDQTAMVMSPIGRPMLGTIPASTSVSDSDDDWTFRAGARASVNYRINWFEISLTGIVDYWDEVAVVEYPTYGVAEWDLLPTQTVSNKVPEIDEDHMTNYSLLLNATFYF